MLTQGYERSSYDCCVYFRHVSNRISIYLLIYVDDMLIASQSDKEIQQLKVKLKFAFEMKELGEARKILEIEIKRDKQERKLLLSQRSYL